MYILRKDKKYVSHHDTELEALQELHRIQGMSHDYAFKFGGYTLTNETVFSIDPITHKAGIRSQK